MNFPDLFKLLKEKNRVDLIDPIEDFRDAALDKIKGDSLTPKEVLSHIKSDKRLVGLAGSITEQSNLRTEVVKMVIRELASKI
jgi:hypothetical protein